MRSLQTERSGRRRVFSCSVAASVLTLAGSALAQEAPARDAAQASKDAALPAAVPGGITAEQVATRAAATSYQARAAEQNVSGATARADQAWTSYLPRLGVVGRYTRLSSFTPPSLGDFSLVGTAAPAGTVLTVPVTVNGITGLAVNTPLVSAGGFSFPLVLDNWLAQATIAIPISDYFLRINQAYTAATNAEEAARYDLVTARAKSYADGKLAYYTWLRARGGVVVAQQSLAVAQAHLKDAQNQFAVGNASRADVLRAETQVAAAELAVERAKNAAIVTERQVRIAIHAKEEERVDPGEPLDGPLSRAPGNVRALVAEAQASRPEIKSIDKNADAARKQAAVLDNGKYPSLSGFGDATYANPNQRRFPQQNEWFPTWSVGAQVTWSPNDMLVAGPASADANARAAALEAQKGVIRDGVELEVTQAYQSVLEADVAITSTTRQLESALEGYRVARELFNAGRGTATTLVDAETVLAQTRFDHLNARVDAHLARIRLDHALGRDVR